jgi:hypothetical protein
MKAEMALFAERSKPGSAGAKMGTRKGNEQVNMSYVPYIVYRYKNFTFKLIMVCNS